MNTVKFNTASARIGGHKPPTMIDVARHAGVSPMTVSRVINGMPFVKAETRRKVLKAVEALAYAPNLEARTLAGIKPIRIGMLYRDARGSYLNEFIIGLLREASVSNVHLFVEQASTRGSVANQATRLIRNGLDGLILAPPLADDGVLVERLRSARVPALLAGCGLPVPGLHSIGIDERAAAAQMTQHLLRLGHRRIAFLVGQAEQSSTAQRLLGFRETMAERGIDVAPEYVVDGGSDYPAGLLASMALLMHAPRPSAIFASNDDMAAAAFGAARQLGLDVPGNLSVVGFDDAMMSAAIWPPLTTVRQPVADMARLAVRTLVRSIRFRRDKEADQPECVLLPFGLVRRQSDSALRREGAPAAGRRPRS
jgi:LacI family transcriptional regulator